MSPGRARAESALHRLKERAAAAAGYQPPMTGVSRALLRERSGRIDPASRVEPRTQRARPGNRDGRFFRPLPLLPAPYSLIPNP